MTRQSPAGPLCELIDQSLQHLEVSSARLDDFHCRPSYLSMKWLFPAIVGGGAPGGPNQ